MSNPAQAQLLQRIASTFVTNGVGGITPPIVEQLLADFVNAIFPYAAAGGADAAATSAAAALASAQQAQAVQNAIGELVPGISPVLFGAKFDGVTDDTAAFVAAGAVAATIGSYITMPPGTSVISPIAIPAARGLLGAGKAMTKLIASRAATYPNGGALLGFANPAKVSGFLIDLDDSKFNNTTGVLGSSITGDFSVTDVGIVGQPYFGIAVDTVSGRVDVSGNSTAFTNKAGLIGIRLNAITNGELRGNIATGSYGAHAMAVVNSQNIRAYSNKIDVTFTGAFGISFEDNTGCMMWGNTSHNTGFEAFQLTQCQHCSITNSYAWWDAGLGADFGSSMESCSFCNIDSNHFVNSYKGAVGLASDTQPGYANRVAGNIAQNCATRATAAGIPGNYTDQAAFAMYTPASGSSLPIAATKFVDNTIITDAGNAINYGFEEAANGSNVIQDTQVRGTRFIGGGVVGVPYNILGPGGHVWADEWMTWTPTIGATSGTISSVTAVTAKFMLQGAQVHFKLQFTIQTNGSAGGALSFSLPKAAGTATQSLANGKEIGVTGKHLDVTIGTSGFISFYDNSYPGANGAVIAVEGWYEIP